MIEQITNVELHCTLCDYRRPWLATDSFDKPCPACRDGSSKFWSTEKPNA